MARAEFQLNVQKLKDLDKTFKSATVRSELERVASRAEVAGMVAQAIADNFAKEGPGWAPLKGATIRASIAKNAMTKRLLNDARIYAARKIGAVKTSKSGKQSVDRQAMRAYRRKDKTQKTFLNHVDEYIENIERVSRKNAGPNDALGNRQILRRTSLLFQTVTTPNFSGSSKSGNKTLSGSNINRTEGTNLIWGTNLVYAGVHQNGDPERNIPQRKFLYLQDEWKTRLAKYVAKLMRDVLKGKLK